MIDIEISNEAKGTDKKERATEGELYKSKQSEEKIKQGLMEKMWGNKRRKTKESEHYKMQMKVINLHK